MARGGCQVARALTAGSITPLSSSMRSTVVTACVHGVSPVAATATLARADHAEEVLLLGLGLRAAAVSLGALVALLVGRAIRLLPM
jgi:hypothetical protein